MRMGVKRNQIMTRVGETRGGKSERVRVEREEDGCLLVSYECIGVKIRS